MSKFFLAVSLLACASPPKTITLLHTTDLHANVVAWDYYADKPDPKRGLAKAASVIRARTTQCTLVIDTGDALQGAPLGPAPMAAAMNAAGYSAMALGNHDFNFGLGTLRKFMEEARFAVLAANVSGFNAFVIEETCAVKVGILGLVTPRVDTWERPEHIKGLKFSSALAVAKALVPEIRKQGAQIVVVAIHAGPHGDGLPGENEAGLIAEQVPGVDVILSGHTHLMIPKLLVNGVLISQPGFWGSHVGETTLTFKGSVVAKDSRLIPVDQAPEHPDVLAAVSAAHEATRTALSVPIGSSSVAMPGGEVGRFKHFALASLINAAQLEATGADISVAAIFSGAGLPSGPITMRDVAAVYVYENTLHTVEVTREQLLAALEDNARFSPQTHDAFQWDLYSGLDYTVDFTKPAGSRVTLRSPRPRYVLAVNNYRAAQFKSAKPVRQSQDTVRDILANYIKSHSPLPAPAPLKMTLVGSP